MLIRMMAYTIIMNEIHVTPQDASMISNVFSKILCGIHDISMCVFKKVCNSELITQLSSEDILYK